MKAIMVMFDSLNRHMLPNYGCDAVYAPNFARLGEKTVTFDNAYVGSMPCMPARRDLHTGRLNFLHRTWGPLEPFDDSMPEMLKNAGIHTHLVSDHHHYWEDGGANYHPRYSTFEYVRGQEGDHWKGQLRDPEIPESLELPSNMGGRNIGEYVRQDWVNRGQIHSEEDFPIAKTFKLGMDFIRENKDEDNWFLQLETFDPHEPYNVPQRFLDLYPHEYHGKHFDWPPYARVTQTPEEVNHVRCEYMALVSMCDEYLGKVLDLMDEYDMWKDTLLIVNSDHGFLLGEHGWWAKCKPPFYNEVAHIPLFIWDPRCAKTGEHRGSLVQTIDLPVTLLKYFGLEPTKDMEGRDLADTVSEDVKVHDAVIFGIHGGHVNCTDGHYVYMRGWGEENLPIYNYTLVPAHVRRRFYPEELKDAELSAEFSFTKGIKILKVPGTGVQSQPEDGSTMLFDLVKDPGQLHPIEDPEVEKQMIDQMVRLMKANEAPAEQYERLGLKIK